MRREVFQNVEYMRIDLREWLDMANDYLKASAEALRMAKGCNAMGRSKWVERQMRKRQKTGNSVTPDYASYWHTP